MLSDSFILLIINFHTTEVLLVEGVGGGVILTRN